MEDKNHKKGIDKPVPKSGKVSTGISIAAYIATAAAVLIALFTLLEMKAQRLQTEKPRLLLSSTHGGIDIYWTKIEDPFPAVLPLAWGSIPTDVGEDTAPRPDITSFLDYLLKLERSMELELINAGLGPAIELTINWEIEKPIDKLIQQLNQSNLGVLLELEHRSPTSRIIWITDMDRRHPFGYGFSASPLINLPYSLPCSSIEENKTTILVPGSLMLFLHLMLAANTMMNDSQRFPLPRLYCSISSKDRAGKEYKDNFVLDFQVLMTQTPKLPEPNTRCAMLLPRLSLKF